MVCDNKSIGRTLRGISHGKPEQLEEQREETRLIIEELLEDGSDPDALYTIEHHLPQTIWKPRKKQQLKRLNSVTK